MAMLQRAAERPVHAYLLVGPRGSGIETAARCFAGLLIGAGDDDRVLRGRHPDVVEFRPVATTYSVERDVRAAILPAVHASPIETERKCVVLLEADRLNPESSNTLLKSIEEPPERTIIILVAESAAELLDTIRSRCQQVDFGALGHRGAARGARAPRRTRSAVASRGDARRRPARPRGRAHRSAGGTARRVRRRSRARRWIRRDGCVARRRTRRGGEGHAGRARDDPEDRARRSRRGDRAAAVRTADRAGDAQARHRSPEARGAPIASRCRARRDHRDRVRVPGCAGRRCAADQPRS